MKTLAQKTILLTTLLVISSTLAITLVFYNSGKEILINHAMEDLSSTARQEGAKIQAIIEELKNDTLFLAGTPPIQGIFRAERNKGYDASGKSTRQQWQQRLENIFTTLLHAKPHYLQARLLDANGIEKIRIENESGNIATVSKENLQDKSRERYTQLALQLPSGRLYLSDVNLNREHGKIEVPHIPVIRSATSIYDDAGNVMGAIVINMDFGKELTYIENLYRQGNHELLIANNKGHYLVHPDTNKRFGFELGHRYRVHEDHPRLARLFIPGNKETSITLLPYKSSQNAMVMVKLPLDVKQPERFLAIILARPYKTIIDEETTIIRDNLWLGILLILISAFLAYTFTHRVVDPLRKITKNIEAFRQGKSDITHPAKTQDEIGILTTAFEGMMQQVKNSEDSLKQMNRHLEQEVEHRTLDLNQNLKLLNTILESLPLMMFLKDAQDLRFVRFNKAGEEMIGTTRENLLGKNDYDFFPKDQADFFTTMDREVISNGDTIDIPEEPIQTPQGERILHTRKTVITDEDGKPVYLLGLSEDITERKQIENSLHDSEARTRAVVNTMVDALITIDEHGHITAYNPAAEIMFGYAANEVLDKNINILMPEPYHSQHDAYLHNYLTSGIKRIIGSGREVVGLRKNGEEFPMELAVSETVVADKRIFIGVVRDITERKRIDQMKNEFISTVSHELRTPLTSIRGSLGLISGGAVGEMSEQAASLLQIAHKNTERLLLLINDILDLQKIESGKMPFDFKDVLLDRFITEAISSNEPFARIQEVTLLLENHTAPDTMIIADHDRLMQVMNNLLSNAAKFSPSASKILVELSSDDSNVTIAITDQGPGIPENFRQKLFDKFTQSDSSDTRQVGGTGLGLSIAKLIIEKHNGEIGFDTVMGKGTTFYIKLPLLQQSTNQQIIGSTPEANARDILIIEDDSDIATLLALHLKHAGYHSQIAYSAAEAKELLHTQNFVAITLDLMLPDENGISLIKQLRAEPEFEALPIIVISVKADVGKKELNGGAVGIIDWLSKPFDAHELERALFKAIHHSVNTPKVLYIEDDQDILQIVNNLLKDQTHLTTASTLTEARQQLKENSFDLILLDLGLPDGSGLDLLTDIKNSAGNPPVVVFSANEVASSEAEKVSKVLIKSQTSNEELLTTIKHLLAN